MNKFSSSKNKFTLFILGSLIVFFTIILILNITEKTANTFPIIALGILISLILWIVLDTRYVLKNNLLLYRSGPFRGSIPVHTILKIKKHSGLNVPVLMKPALDTDGFIITTKNSELFISPKSSILFMEELKKINPNIEVI
ncbi:MAG: hypothetical protein ACI9XR_002172 [Flavobacterium sp.]|jgi:hypothetical protein